MCPHDTTMTRHTTWCCMTPSVLLSTSLALATLARALLQAGTATADTSRVAFAVSTSRSSALRSQQAHETRSAFYYFPAATSSHSLGLRRRRTPPQLLLSWSTDCGVRHSSQWFAGEPKRAASITMVSRGMRRKLFSVLGAARTSFGAATASEASGDAAKQQTAWRRGGGTAMDSSVDRTAPSEVQRALSVREQIVQMLRPELPRVSKPLLQGCGFDIGLRTSMLRGSYVQSICSIERFARLAVNCNLQLSFE